MPLTTTSVPPSPYEILQARNLNFETSSFANIAMDSNARPGGLNSSKLVAYSLDSSSNIVALTGASGTVGLTLGPVTFANLLTTYPAATYPGYVAKVSNVGGSTGSFWVSDGTRWKPKNGSVVVYSMDTPVPMTGITITVLGQYLFPAAVLQLNDRIRFRATFSKSASSETRTIRVKLGTLGTTSDTTLFDTGAGGATSVSEGFDHEFKIITATTIQRVGNGSTTPFNGGSLTAYPTATTISSVTSNAMYLSICALLSSTVETLTLQDLQIELLSTTA